MKKLIASALSLFTVGAMASTCPVVITNPPGGFADITARMYSRINPEFNHIEYKAGAYASVATNFLNDHPEFILFSSPIMFSSKAVRAPDVELADIMIGIDLTLLTNSKRTLEDAFTKPVKIGVSALAGGPHLFALQMQEINPQILIVPTGGEQKALPLLKQNEIDFYLSAKSSTKQWLPAFGFEEVLAIPFGKTVDYGNRSLFNLTYSAAFLNKNATPAQRDNILRCLRELKANPQFAENIKANGDVPAFFTEAEKRKMLDMYVDLMKKNGL